MAVEVAAALGERWPEEEDEDEPSIEPPPDYRDGRTSVVLGEGETAAFEIRTDFEPDRVLVDPDVLVLQLNRERAVFEFEG